MSPIGYECEILEIITIDDFKAALQNKLGKKGISSEHIEKLAEYVMNFFGFNDYIIDNVLNSKDRDVFYMLEEEGLLKTEREEVNIKKGKNWRIHYWILNKEKIFKFARTTEVEEVEEHQYAVYDDLSDEIWQRGND